MSRSIPTLVAAIGLLTATSLLAADEAYTLKLYQSKKGDKSEHEITETSKTNLVLKVKGEEKKEEKTAEKKDVYAEEILEKKAGDKLATKLTRTYKVAEKTEQGETTKAKYTDKTVLVERKGDDYSLSIDGTALEAKDAPDLFRTFNRKKHEPKTEDFLPAKALKVGESWTVPAEKSEELFKNLSDENLKFDAKKSTASGKLVKVYKKDNAQFGVMEITLTAFVTEMKLGKNSVPTSDGSKIVMEATIDTCIDGSVETEDSKMKRTVDILIEVPNVTVTIKGTASGTNKVKVLK